MCTLNPSRQPLSQTHWVAKLPDLWLVALCVVLAGYALFGRGFAYLGVPPLYVGEMCLAAGIVVFWVTPGWHKVARIPIFWLLILMWIWGALRCIPYLDRFGMLALRDSAILSYALFSVLIATVILADPRRLKVLIERFDRFGELFVFTFFPIFILCQFGREAIPVWTWVEIPIIHQDCGHVLVHLAGIAAFLTVGLSARVQGTLLVIMVLEVAAASVITRGGMLSFAAAFPLALACRWRSRIGWGLVAVAIVGAVTLTMSNVEFKLPGNRSFSYWSLADNIASISSSSKSTYLQGTKDWRLEWWSDILDYTVFGEYFWDGKGFGVNLADDDGYQVTHNNSLRSPHNGHLTVLARTGVPGLLLWLALHTSWVVSVVRGIVSSRRRGEMNWYALFVFLLAYWTAFMVNATFDVFLEGPMGGIWFWTVFGVGIAATEVYRTHPQILRD